MVAGIFVPKSAICKVDIAKMIIIPYYLSIIPPKCRKNVVILQPICAAYTHYAHIHVRNTITKNNIKTQNIMRKMNFLLNWSKKDQVKREQAESGYGLPVIGYGKQKAWMKVKLVKLVNFAMQIFSDIANIANIAMRIFNSVWCKVYRVESRKTDGEQPRNHQLISNLSLTVGSCCPRVASVLHSLRSRFDSVSILSRQSDLDQVRAVSVGLSARVWKHVAMIFAVLVMSIANIGMAWGADKYYILGAQAVASDGALTKASSHSNLTLKYIKYDGSTYSTTTDISFSATDGINGKYESSAASANISSILNSAKWGTGSGSAYAAGIKFAKNTTYTLSLGSKTITKISFLIYPAGKASSITIGGTAKTTSSQAWTLHEWTGSFTGNVSMSLSNDNGVYGVFILETAAASDWQVKGLDDGTWAGFNMTGTGTVTCSRSLSANTEYTFKLYNTSTSKWWGNGTTYKMTQGQTIVQADAGANCKLRTSKAGTYTFSFNTSTNELTVTYPDDYKGYWTKNGASWSKVYAYCYNDGTWKNANWPGVEITDQTEDICGTHYYINTSGYTTVIFNNGNSGSGNQTENIAISGGEGKHAVGAAATAFEAFPTYTITFAANGGSSSMSNISSIACGSDQKITANGYGAPSGYQFAGWKANVAVTIDDETVSAGTIIADQATLQNISSDITLTAQWELIPTYDVIYNTNGGTGGSTASQTGNLSGAQVTTSANGFTKTGYKFKWWNTAANGSGEDFYPGEKVTIASADVNLYAQWEEVAADWAYWVGDVAASSATTDVTGNGVTMRLTRSSTSSGKVDWNTDLTNNATVVSQYSSIGKHAKVLAVADNNYYLQVHFTDGSPINSLKLGVAAKDDGDYEMVVIYSTTADFSSGVGEKVAHNTPRHSQTSKSVTDFSPSTENKYYYARIYRNVTTAVYSLTGGSAHTIRIYSVKAEKGHICNAPSALAAASTTAKGTTFTVTDGDDTNNYEFYVSTESTAPTAGSSATHTVSGGKTKTITDCVAGTTYYAWVRSVCGVSNKSGWMALTNSTFTTSTVTVTHTLTNVTKTSGATTAGGSDYTAVYSANTDYSMPTPTVTIDGNTATSGTDYTWNAGTGTITISANKINGNIVITLNSVPSAPSSAVISGTYHYFPGENISLTCTPSGNNGPTTYQWYKGGKENGNAIEGATSATYTKNSCTFDDAGSYYCKVTCNATSIWAVTNSHENYDVKILRLYVKGSKGGQDYGNVDFVKVNSTTATASIALGSNWTYGFNIADGCGHYYGNSGTMQYNNYGPWVTNVDGTDCGLTTTNAATYIFTINYSNLSSITTTVTFPVANQAAGKVIYFDNNVLKWTGSSIYYRIGHSSHTQADQLSLVPGTANLYKMTTREYNNFSAWQIGNAEGDNGSGKSIYNTKNSPAITASTAYEGGAVTADAVTVTPGEDHSTGGSSENNNCEFYSKTITNGMKTDNVAISPYSNGTITVNYTNTSGSAATLTSGNADLAHTVILTSITAEPNTGYDASAITINGGAYSANYVVTGSTTIAASFTPHVYSITYKDQGGSDFSGSHVDSPSAHPTSHTYGTATTLKSATKDGYTFGGWFGNPECTGVALSSIGATSISADITLYAKWTVNNYDLTWDTNGGSDLVCTGSCTEGTTAYGTTIVAPSDPTLSNYTFDGWKTNNDGTGTAAAATMPAADATYYAAWKQTVTLKTGSQGSGADKTPYVYLNGAGVSSFTAHSADGYTLQGYYTASLGGVKVLNADGTFAGSNVTDYITSSKWSRTGATTLYAQWLASVDCSTSDFVIKKGSSTEYQGCMESTSYDGTATSFTAGSPTTVGNAKMTISNYDGGIKRPGSGNVFSIVIEPVSGYYLKSVCWAGKVEDDETVSYYWDNNSGSATTITPQTTSGTGVTYNAPNSTTTKFTASYTDDGDKSGGIWWRNVQVEVCAAGGATYNVTYDDNGKTGGSVPTDATAYSYGGTVTVKGNTGSLAKTNYTFAGWATNDDGTGSNYVADNTFSITDNTTLYAKWTQAVTLDANTANHGSTGGSATAVWNATGLTGITHATPASGYKLTGYYTAATSGTKVLNSDGTYASTAVTDYITSGKWSRTGTAPTLYAQYEAAGALTWNLVVNSDTTALATASKTSAFTEISTSNMTDAAVNGVTYSKGKKSSLTGKISTPSSYDASKYVYVTFQVASGYKFTPSSIKVKAQPVTTEKDVKLSLTDESSHSLVSASATSVSGGSTQTVTLAGDGTFFTGTVTLKIYCYGATDAYRLGTPITIEGAVEATCTMPSYTKMSYTTTEYIKDAEASAISVLGGENVTTYQWKYNTTSDRTSGTNCGTNSASYTPSTGSTGTLYYWCELTNACGTIKTPAVGITVSAYLTDPTVVWTDPAGTVNYGGGGYTIRATVQETGWSGTLAASMLTAPAGIRIYDVTTGTDGSSKKYIEATFDVQTTFDRTEYTSAIPFTLSLPETNYAAKDFDHDVAYTSCSGSGAGTSYNIRVRKSYTKVDNKYYWDNTDGWISSPNPSSSISSSKASTTMATVFDSVSSSNADLVYIRTYHANIKKVRIYADFRANNMTVSNVYKNSDFFSANSKYEVDYSVVYNGDEENADLGTAAQGYVDITLSTVMAANDILLVKFNTSRVRPLGAVITEGSAGSLTTALTFATAGPIAKTQSSANFTNAATVTTYSETLGTISYSSSNTDCATVNATTGEVTITASGAADLSTTITATLAASGCYKSATATYVINVPGVSCTIDHGTLSSDVTSKCPTDDATLTLTDFEAGATIQWYNGESPIDNGSTYAITTAGTTSTMVTKEAGTYSVMVTKDACTVRSNSVTVSNISAEASATKIVDSWYVKNGRLTPDIALWTLGEGTTLKSVAWSPSNATGLSLYEGEDGIVYLEGKEPSANTSGADIVYTLTLTVTDACGTNHALSTETITITHQKNTDKHVLAFVVTGTEKGGWTAGIPSTQTTGVDLYNTIAANFDVLATNIYSTDDEQKLKEYYSQFDILCITDYPNTGTKGVNKKSYVDAIGALIDIRPILTMEAFVSKLTNWKAKGISGTPESPSTRQYSMLLQCKDHEIFSGCELTKVGEGEETMYRINMVDNTKESYATLDASYSPGSKDYDAGGKPALQGFTFTSEMADADLLPLGLIDDGAGNDLQVGIERQHEMSARLMVLGINGYAMERLATDGQTVVVNALKYLMKKSAEDIADCSNNFVGGVEGHEDEWEQTGNWSGNTLPDKTQNVRILAPCVISDGTIAHVAGVKIIPSGKINHGADDAAGQLTIAAGGALKVEGKVEAATAPAYNRTRPTAAGDLIIGANSSAQGCLIFDNEEGETNATVAMYSASYWEVVDGKKKKYWSYVAIPIQSGTVGEYFYNGFSYLYDETSGWIKKGMYTELHAFEGLGISMQTGNMEYFHGALAPTTTQEITLTKTPAAGDGENLIGNSWTAPIQIANFDVSDFGDATATVMIYSTGRDDVKDNPTYVTATVENDGAVSAGQWLAIPIGLPGTTGYDGLSVIPAMQAFQVNTASETTLILDYDKLVRDVNLATDNLTEKQHSPVRRAVKKDLASVMRVRVSGTRTRADVWLLEDNRFSDEFDNGWEAAYIDCDERSPQLYAQSTIGKMAFLAQPDMEGTVLGIAPSRDGNEYLFTFHYVGSEEYYLNDIKLQKATLINDENSYEFTFDEGDTNRFYISRTPLGKPAITTGVENTNVTPKAQKFIYQDKLYILRNGVLYDATGKVVK